MKDKDREYIEEDYITVTDEDDDTVVTIKEQLKGLR